VTEVISNFQVSFDTCEFISRHKVITQLAEHLYGRFLAKNIFGDAAKDMFRRQFQVGVIASTEGMPKLTKYFEGLDQFLKLFDR
jgi:hypothetical protein